LTCYNNVIYYYWHGWNGIAHLAAEVGAFPSQAG
jgi:hypothetical protein